MAPPNTALVNLYFSPRGMGFDLEGDLRVLAVAAGLLLVRVLRVRLALDGFPVGDARDLRLHLDLLVLPDLVEDHADVQLAHARDDRFLGFLVVGDLERQILLHGAVEHLVHLVLVLFRLCRDGQGVDGGVQLEGGIDDGASGACRVSLVLQGRALREQAQVSGDQLGDVLELLAQARIDLGDLLLLSLARVHEIGVRGDLSRHDLEEGELAGELVHGGLEDEAGGGLRLGDLPSISFPSAVCPSRSLRGRGRHR